MITPELVAEGRTSREIAGHLSISLKTVLGHRTKMMKNQTSIVAPNSLNMRPEGIDDIGCSKVVVSKWRTSKKS